MLATRPVHIHGNATTQIIFGWHQRAFSGVESTVRTSTWATRVELPKPILGSEYLPAQTESFTRPCRCSQPNPKMVRALLRFASVQPLVDGAPPAPRRPAYLLVRSTQASTDLGGSRTSVFCDRLPPENQHVKVGGDFIRGRLEYSKVTIDESEAQPGHTCLRLAWDQNEMTSVEPRLRRAITMREIYYQRAPKIAEKRVSDTAQHG